MSKPGPDKRWLWPGLIFGLGLIVRLLLVSHGPYHSDCLLLALKSQQIIHTQEMQYLQSSGLPLTALSGALFVFLYQAAHNLDRAVQAVNMMSVIYGSLSVLLIYLCVAQLRDEITARFAAIISAINPFLVGMSTFGNSHSVSLFFLLAAVYFLLLYSRKERRLDLLLAGLMLGCTGAARIQDLVVMAIPLLLLMIFQVRHFSSRSGKVWLYMVLPWLMAGSVIFLAYWPKFVTAAGVPGESVGEFLHVHLFAHIDPLPASGYVSMLVRLLQTFSPVEWVLMGGGVLILLKRNESQTLALLVVWLLTPMLAFGQLAFFVFRFLLPTVIALVVLESVAAAELWQRRKWLGAIGLIIVLGGLIHNGTHYHKIFQYRHNHALLVDFFRWVQDVTEPDAYVIERDHSAWVTHYAQRQFIGVDRSSQKSIIEFQSKVDTLLQQQVPVYITKHGLIDRTDIFRRTLLDRYRLDYVGTHMIEDWHLGCLKQVVVPNDLLRIRPREN